MWFFKVQLGNAWPSYLLSFHAFEWTWIFYLTVSKLYMFVIRWLVILIWGLDIILGVTQVYISATVYFTPFFCRNPATLDSSIFIILLKSKHYGITFLFSFLKNEVNWHPSSYWSKFLNACIKRCIHLELNKLLI